MLLYGKHACLAALANPKRMIKKILISNKEWEHEIPLAHKSKITLQHKKELDKKIENHANHQGIIVECNTLEKDNYYTCPENKKNACVMILDQVSDVHNMGAIIRSCAVFGVDALIISEKNAPKESGLMAKIASGGLEKVNIIISKNLSRTMEDLKSQQFWIFGLMEDTPKRFDEHNLTGRIAIVMGREGEGMRHNIKTHCDFLAFLPSSPDFSTLNVSNAAAISLYEIFKQQMS